MLLVGGPPGPQASYPPYDYNGTYPPPAAYPGYDYYGQQSGYPAPVNQGYDNSYYGQGSWGGGYETGTPGGAYSAGYSGICPFLSHESCLSDVSDTA